MARRRCRREWRSFLSRRLHPDTLRGRPGGDRVSLRPSHKRDCNVPERCAPTSFKAYRVQGDPTERVTLPERSHVLASLAAAENEDDIDREPLEKAKQTRVATA